MFEYYYNEIFRKTIIGFGTLFNSIDVKHFDESGSVSSVIRVPLAYGPIQKFLARIEQQPNLNTPVQMTLPRMSFEFVGLSYDPTRKLTTTQTFISKSQADNSDLKKTYMPVPYNMQFELSIMTKLNDDMLQIIEQILPYFQPSYNLTIDLVKTIGEKRDVSIVLDGINMEDNYEGDYSTRRALVYTLRFSAKTYLFGPSSSASKDIIKRASITLVSGDSKSTSRDLTYSVTPVATKSYSNLQITTLLSNMSESTTEVTVAQSANIAINSYVTIDNETMKVVDKIDKTDVIDQDTLVLSRGQYGTRITTHVSGTPIELITEADNALIQPGDDFGFDGNSF
jgi:hypothetical protein